MFPSYAWRNLKTLENLSNLSVSKSFKIPAVLYRSVWSWWEIHCVVLARSGRRDTTASQAVLMKHWRDYSN